MAPYLLALSLLLCACASRPQVGWPVDEGDSKAPGAAYAGYGMTYGKATPKRNRERFDFYFKHCSDIGDGNYYSKTGFECSAPF